MWFYETKTSTPWCLSKAEANKLVKYSGDEEQGTVLDFEYSGFIHENNFLVADTVFKVLQIWFFFFPAGKLPFIMPLERLSSNATFLFRNPKRRSSNQFNKIVFFLQNAVSWKPLFHSPFFYLECIPYKNVTEVNALNPSISIYHIKALCYRRYFACFGHRSFHVRIPNSMSLESSVIVKKCKETLTWVENGIHNTNYHFC